MKRCPVYTALAAFTCGRKTEREAESTRLARASQQLTTHLHPVLNQIERLCEKHRSNAVSKLKIDLSTI